MEKQPQSLKSIIGDLGRDLGLKGPTEMVAVMRAWRDIVGPAIASHAEPTSLREGVLRVRADSPAWAQEIGYLTRQILARCDEVVGAGVVRDMRVWTGPGKVVADARSAPARERRDPAAEAAPEIVRSDPFEALEGAREAWARRRSEGSTKGSTQGST